MKSAHSLQHQFLIAMPSLDDSWFEKTVIYVIEDNNEGSTGLVVNKPHSLNVGQILEHFHIHTDLSPTALNQTILMGGPVDIERGFILHQPVGGWQNTVDLNHNLGLTVSEDFLQALAEGTAPQDHIIFLGMASWGKGQLASEIQRNNWLTAPYNASLIFETQLETRWKVALGMLGVSPEFLSGESGHA
ncbi:MAG: YqgE/AlgH family protein [Thiomicrospira sp.]|uniref:YqgE/AlgH family protein n=1 Tax=Thiomicrospira sp. TaxID=935 RepID=UPI0019E1ABDE|nr:YqgE/AlgH family protein [Thiomicrospira sp.]MBE0493165.1 YqgE/AlgH family protein [Thiomicrospira sp.]